MKHFPVFQKLLSAALSLMLGAGCFSTALADNPAASRDTAASSIAATDTDIYYAQSSDAAVTASGTCGDNAAWTLTADGTLTISGSGNMQESMGGSNSCPWENYRDSIIKVKIGYQITSLSSSAFYRCKNLKEVGFGSESTTVIPQSAFQGCSSLENLILPMGVQEIGDNAFKDCTSLEWVTVYSQLTSIGSGAFYGCTGLKKISDPIGLEHLENVGSYAFYNCSSLTKIDLGTEMSWIGGYAFSGCTSLEQVDMPDTIDTIARGAFSGCTSLKQITIPAELPKYSNIAIENGAFSGCTALKEITFTCKEAVSIGSDAFAGVAATAYYPSSWTKKPSSSYYGGTLNWVCDSSTLPTPTPTPTASPVQTADFTVYDYNDLLDTMYGAAYCLMDEFTIYFADQTLYNTFISDASMYYEAEQNAGMYSAYFWWYTDASKRTVGFQDIVYYPGSRIAWAWATGDTSFLTDREVKTLAAAEKLLKSATAKCTDTISTEKAIHDALAKKVKYDYTKYSSGAMQERDTAIGSLLNGVADCDGYADAFYLLCYMAGINVRYMHVTSRKASDPSDASHMLNQIQLDDGKWYLVDITWDDPDSGSLVTYRCFNIGAGMADYYYQWNTALFSERLQEYANNDYVLVQYSFSPESYALDCLSEAKDYMNYMYKNGYRHLVFTIADTSLTGKQISKQSSKRHNYICWQRNGYTYFDIYWY